MYLLTKINFLWLQQGSSSGDANWDPDFGAWNIVQCKDGTQLRLDLTEANANGAIVAADILLRESRTHTLFAFRNQGTLDREFTVEISESNYVEIWRYTDSGSWESVISANPLNLSKSNPFLIDLKFS